MQTKTFRKTRLATSLSLVLGVGTMLPVHAQDAAAADTAKKSDKIEVKYNIAKGPISKTITVETNAVNIPKGVVPLRIKGTVIVKEIKK